MLNLEPDFKEFIELLNSKRVEYILVGGYAVAFYGHPRYTGDIDFWIAIAPENAARILAVLKEFGFSALGIKADDLLSENQIVQLGYPPLRIDLITSVDGLSFRDCYINAKETVIDGTSVRVLNLQDLRRYKAATGRDKDRDDLRNLPDA
jgi:predicted nucleotidyltransferase